MIVFDLDSTLRDTSCADHLVPTDPTKAFNWVDWQWCVNNKGTVIEPIARLFKTIDTDITVVTSSQFGSSTWLYNHGLYPDDIVERKYDDDRHPFQYKKDFIDEHKDEITLWVDDSPSVLDYVDSLGIPVVRVKNVSRDMVSR